MKLSTWLKDLPDDYARCRALRHAWGTPNFRAIESPQKGRLLGLNQSIGRMMRCEFCGVGRLDIFSRNRVTKGRQHPWLKTGVRYVYPSDYQFDSVKVDGDRPRQNDFDNELLNRQIPVPLR